MALSKPYNDKGINFGLSWQQEYQNVNEYEEAHCNGLVTPINVELFRLAIVIY